MIIAGTRTMIEMLMPTELAMLTPKITERTIMGNPTITQHHCAVDQAAERANLVQYDQHAGANRQQLGQYIGERPLMFQIYARDGLIQHQQIRLTGECSGNQHALLLTAGQRSNVSVETVGQPDPDDGIAYGVTIFSGQWSEWPSARQPSRSNDLHHFRAAQQCQRALWDIPNPRPLTETAQRLAEQMHLAALVGEQAQQCTDQGGFPRTVSAHQSDSLARPYRKAYAAQHGKPAAFDSNGVGRQHCCCI
jgi:hypothetical protein